MEMHSPSKRAYAGSNPAGGTATAHLWRAGSGNDRYRLAFLLVFSRAAGKRPATRREDSRAVSVTAGRIITAISRPDWYSRLVPSWNPVGRSGPLIWHGICEEHVRSAFGTTTSQYRRPRYGRSKASHSTSRSRVGHQARRAKQHGIGPRHTERRD